MTRLLSTAMTLLVCFGLGFAFIRTLEGELSGPVFFLAMAAAIPPLVWAAATYWRGLDELAREAHKSAWMWGGSTGLILSVVPMIVLTGEGAERISLLRRTQADRAFVEGALGGFFIAVLTTSLGYLIAWVIYWLRKR